MKKSSLAKAAVVSGIALSLTVGQGVAYAAGGDARDPKLQEGVARIWGDTRADTSVKASQILSTDHINSKTREVFIVGGQAWPDALAVTPLADATDTHVLITSGPDTLNQSVVDEINRLADHMFTDLKITIIGGPISVSPDVEASLRADFPDSLISRVWGDTRYETAYYLAAYASAAYNDGVVVPGPLGYEGVGGLLEARSDLAKLQAAEFNYQQALDNYNKAADDYTQKLSAVRSTQAEIDSLQKQIADLSATLKPTTGMEGAQVLVKTTKTALDVANHELAEAQDDVAFLNELITSIAQQYPDITIKSTIHDYMDHMTADQKARMLLFMGRVPIVLPSTTMERAIEQANDQVQLKSTVQKAASAAFAEAVTALTNLQWNDEFNKPIIAQIATLTNQLNDDLKKQVGQNSDLAKALLTIEDAKVKLAATTLLRPTSATLDAADALLKKRIDISASEAGNRTVFLANGTNFPDALVGGPAASHTNGVVLLTRDATVDPWSAKLIDMVHPQVVTVGAPATTAAENYGKPINVVVRFPGQTRYDTAAAVTQYYFTTATNDAKAPIAVASGEVFPDAVIGGNFIANYNGGVLLTQKSSVPLATLNYLDNVSRGEAVRVFGGPLTIDDSVVTTITNHTQE